MFRATILLPEGEEHIIDVQPGETLLAAATRHGIPIASDCREGVCGVCRGQCTEGNYRIDYYDEDLFTPDDLERGTVLACQMQLLSDCSIHFGFIADDRHAKHVTGKVLSCMPAGSGAVRLSIAIVEPYPPLAFRPGDYARLRVPGTKDWRSYSFLGQPDAGRMVEFLVRLLPRGVMSDYLRERCRPGDNIEIEGPRGEFFFRPGCAELLLIAGGTGLAPFPGIISQAFESGTVNSVRLLYGVGHPGEVCCEDTLQGLAAAYPGFSYAMASRAKEPGWVGVTGLVTDLIDTIALNPYNTDAYLCGPPGMIRAARMALEQAGIPAAQVRFENFSES